VDNKESKMKKKTIILIFLGIVLGNSIPAHDLSVFLGATYNPLNPDYIMGSLVFNRFSNDYDDRHSFIAGARFSYGQLTYRYETSNPFTVQGENTDLWVKGGVFETAASGIYQYAINDTIGLRFGVDLTFLWSGILEGEKPGLSGKGSSFGVTIGAYGILGATIFPKKKFPIVFTVSPGVILDPYFSDEIFPFNLPISLLIGWNGLIDN
jgi:hypothetical protein